MVAYKGILLCILLIQSIMDIKYKKVILELTFAGSVVGVVYIIFHFIEMGFSYKPLLAFCPGLVVFLLAKATREAIGYGDSMIFLMLGFFYDWAGIVEMLLEASILAAVAALILLVIFRKNRKYEIPFVPFLTLVVYMEELWM